MTGQEWRPLGYRALFRELFKEHLKRQEELLGKNRPVGWFFSFQPSELIYVFDLVPAFPEQYSAYCAARGSSIDLIDCSIGAGYSHFLCDYFKNTLGFIIEPSKATPPPMPKPDFIVGMRGLCIAHCEMAELFAMMREIPCYILNCPYWTRDVIGGHDWITKVPEKMDKTYYEYFVDGLNGLIDFLEKITGEKMDEDRFREVFRLSEKTSRMLVEITRLMMAKPTPGSQRDLSDLVFVSFFTLGSNYAYEFASKALSIIKDRVGKGEGVAADEKYRLLTFGIMPWHSLSLYEYCETLGATFPVNIYAAETVHLAEADKPYESMLRRTIHFTNADYSLMYDVVEGVKNADLDGAILFENTGCRVTSMIVWPLADIIEERLGIPSLIIEAPQCDPRITPIDKIKMKIDAFLEALK
ncbi:MAG: 2-hydroxyacyl-CoA dehydratase family protein [Nitrososphaerota archaeon]|nr:2-hydroxyacyl-CoA dehydratase family protein [Candidatus Bathyarchaeota archaeon]MDW8023193.1 2-hydroxyacyl-CoA dehydratase family protein [Nitrososphaerota archaeon]